MGDLYKVLSELCGERNITAYKMCKDVGMQPSVMTDLKMGRRSSVKVETADRIATYFGVSVGYLLGNEKKPTTLEGNELDRQLGDMEFALFGEVKDLTDAEKRDVLKFIKFTKEQRGDK